MSTGKRVQARREELGLSRAELAKKLGITRLKVWRIETGETQIPADELRVFARALQVPVAELVA